MRELQLGERRAPPVVLCAHCGMDIGIRNPSGYCDHLYYPEYCKICRKRDAKCTCGTCEVHNDIP